MCGITRDLGSSHVDRSAFNSPSTGNCRIEGDGAICNCDCASTPLQTTATHVARSKIVRDNALSNLNLGQGRNATAVPAGCILEYRTVVDNCRNRTDAAAHPSVGDVVRHDGF